MNQEKENVIGSKEMTEKKKKRGTPREKGTKRGGKCQ
jgi:hypothetical protein